MTQCLPSSLGGSGSAVLTQVFHHGNEAHAGHEGVIAGVVCLAITIQSVAQVAILYSELWRTKLAAEIIVQVSKGGDGDVHTERETYSMQGA